ncbi:MAG: bifunctional [glutamate--ammonia ligase]-adenylyl-L-tyrosine phosphorylase/[glutamate--ammonia-ligase] adenylyltransferase, partial [Desulfobacula sp.]|nr:bifunctional [glutamate--ammonia ligase]-adenylyl-L-tyrosine phosphorylase/[glutamate--ammonia-ligase] adenylyltransferase [Desulfobacula sp.]
MNNNMFKKTIGNIDNNLLKILKIRLDTLLKSIEKANFEINLKSDQHRDLSNILLFSEFIASSFIRKPQIFYDLITSNDLCKSYSQHTYITRLEKNVSKDMDITELKATLLQIKLYEMIRIAWR